MSDVQVYLDNLTEAFSSSDGNNAKRLVIQIHSAFKTDDLTQLEIESGIAVLLRGDQGKKVLLDLVKSNFMKSNFKDALGCSFELLSDLLNNYDKKMDCYVDEITHICLKVLRSSCHADIKLKSLAPLSRIVSNMSWSQQVPNIAELTVDQILFKKSTPSCMNKQLFLLGKLCEMHPEVMMLHSKKISSTLMNMLSQHLSTIKINFTTIEGMFAAVEGFMKMTDLDAASVDKVYRCIKVFANPRESHRKGFARGAVKLLSSKSGKSFAEHVCTDLNFWLELLATFIQSNNADDKYVGCIALSRVYEYTGSTLASKGSCDYTLKRLQFVMNYFKEIISSETSEDKELEYKLALEGFAVIVSSCRVYIGEEEFNKITQVLIQKAQLMQRDEEEYAEVDQREGYTDRTEKICMYMNALAALGSNAKGCLVDLMKLMVSEYPKCPISKRNKLLFTLVKCVYLVDLQTLVPFIVRESCRHSISLSLEYKKQLGDNREEDSWTYESFMEVWETLLCKSSMGEATFHSYVEHVLKVIPALDFCTERTSLGLENISTEGLENDIDESETPNNIPEYSFFVNLCDLTAGIFTLFTNETLPAEWCHSWLNKLFAMVVEGLSKNPSASSLLKVAHYSLKVAKKLNVFECDGEHEGLSKKILQLFSIISINKVGSLHQLRSAMLLLQTPHQILDEFVLDLASEAFQVVLRNGKNNLDLISDLIETLHEWDCYIERDSFRPLCVKLLPVLNDYLCSSGISDTKVLDSDRSTASRYEFATRRRRLLLTQGASQQLEKVQHKMMRFFGKMDPETLQCLLTKSEDSSLMSSSLEDDLEDVELKDLSEKLKISLPCPEQSKLDIYLDSVLPRVKDLALSSTNRDTRIMACQLLHSLILLTYGTQKDLPQSRKVSLTNTLFELSSVMVALAADTDTTIRDMFEPLLTESCHWFTSPVNASTLETEKFLTSLMKGAYHSSDSLLREKACLALKETVKWSIKQSSDAELYKGPVVVAAILRAICQGIAHPNAFRKRGAFLIFINVATQVYLIESLVDKFLPEILYLSVTCVNSGFGTLDKDYLLYKQEAMQIVQILLKCLKSKAALFKKYNANRRMPEGLGHSSLKDISLWMLKMSKDCTCRITAQLLFKTCFIISNQLDECKDQNLMKYLIETKGLKCIVDNYLEPNTGLDISLTVVTQTSFNQVVSELMALINCIDFHLLLLKNNIVEVNAIYTEEYVATSGIIQHLNYILSTDCRSVVSSLRENDLSPQQIVTLEDVLLKINWRMLEVLIELHNSEINLLFEKTYSCLVVWLFDFRMWTILKRVSDNKDVGRVDKLIQNMKLNQKTGTWNAFINQCEIFPKDKLREILQSYTEPAAVLNNSHIIYLQDCINLYNLTSASRLYTEIKSLPLLEIFKDIFSSSGSKKHTGLEKYVLNFILTCDMLGVSDILCALIDSSSQSVHLNNFFKLYQDSMGPFFIKNYVEMFSLLEEQYSCNLTPVTMILKFLAEAKHKIEDTFLKYLSSWINKVWLTLGHEYSFEVLLEHFTLLVIALPPHIDSMYSAGNMRLWLLQELRNPERDSDKSKLIYLLAALYKPTDDTIVDDELVQAVNVITSCFPHKSDEFPVGSPEREKYLTTYKALLETMANSGNFAIFKAVVDTSCVDKEHICEKQIKHKISSLMERLSPHQAFLMLDWVYAAFLNKSFDPSIRHNVLNRFLVPMLSAASLNALELFYGEHILTIISKLEKDAQTVIASEIPLKHLFLDWNSSFVLAETMFTRVPEELLESPESKIGAHGKKWKSLFSHHCIKIRSTNVQACDNQDLVMEFLRLARCSAYKCLYCIVITSSDEKDCNKLIRKYELLLNSSKGSLLWEGMIDMSKHYVYPLDQTCKLKYHSVKSKKSPNQGAISGFLNQSSLSQSFMGGMLQTDEERRRMLFSQTLQDDVLKYDLNMATVRDFTTFDFNNPQDQVVLQLEDTELLNHEVMATLCCILRDMDRITCPRDADTSAMMTPNWVQNFAAILADRKRHNNVRLFLSQVMVNLRDNDSDIFKKYGSLCLKPLLNIIQDRCTCSGDHPATLNTWDVRILFMLLSWNNCVPSTTEEVAAANFVLMALIQQINPNTQSSDLFKYSLELLKDLLNLWGRHLMIPSDIIISKLQSETEKSLISGIQVIAVTLASGCCPWQSDEEFHTISQRLLVLLNKNESKIYKPAAEVIGLMLEFLIRSCTPSDDEFEMDMESDFYMKYAAFRDSARNKLKDLKSDKPKLVLSIYSIGKHHSGICDESLTDFVVYLIPKLPIHTKKICFKVFLSAVDSFSSTWLQQALINIEIKSYLKDKDLGVVSLHILNKVFDKIELENLSRYMEDVCSLACHKSPDVRSVAYEILMKAYDSISEICEISNNNPSTTSMKLNINSRKRPFENTCIDISSLSESKASNETDKYFLPSIKAALLLGMEDEEENLRSRLCDYWTLKQKNNLQERWLQTLSGLCVDQETLNQGCETERAVRLILETCKRAPDYQTDKLFSHPLENCVFMDYSLDGRKSKRSSLLAPMFAETINSHRQISSLVQSLHSKNLQRAETIASQINNKLVSSNTSLLNSEQRMLRSTLDSFALSLSFNSLGRSFSSNKQSKQDVTSDGFSFQDESSLLFTLEPPLLHRKTYKPIREQTGRGDTKQSKNILPSEERLRRRLISNKNLQKIKFASIAIEKNIKKEQKRLSEKPAPILRSFRKGDYPDVQISLDSVMAPLLGLATRDPIFSKELFVLIFKSLLAHCDQSTADTFKSSTAQFILEHLNTRTIPLTVEAMLEVCRLCLTSGSEYVNDFVRKIAKKNGIEWLGELLVEELSLNIEKNQTKRVKLEEDVNVIQRIPQGIKAQIKSLKWSNQWDKLQDLYQEATADTNLDVMEKLFCTEEYFNCFAHLSDWTGLLEKLKDHLTPDSILENESYVDEPFDMNLLWTSRHGLESYLHLVFMAHIQLRAAVDCVFKYARATKENRDQWKKDILGFTDALNSWMGDPDKNSTLEGRMGPFMSLWRAANGDPSVESCDSSLKWLRQEWTREFSGTTHLHLQDTLDTMLTVSESRNYLDLILSINSSRSNEPMVMAAMKEIQSSWRQCVPHPRSDSMAWDLRLACRSIYTCQLHNQMKSSLEILNETTKNEYRESFIRIQRYSELSLLKTAIHQKNYHLAKKLLNKHVRHVNDAGELFHWQLEEVKFMKLTTEREADLGRRVLNVVKCWSLGESMKKSPNVNSNQKNYMDSLWVSSTIADLLCSTLVQFPWEDCVEHLNTHKHKLGGLLQDTSSDIQKQATLASLIEYSCTLLLDSANHFEQNCDAIPQSESNQNDKKLELKSMKELKKMKQKADVYMNMVEYSRRAKQEYLNDSFNQSLLKLSIIGILKSMRCGSMEARKLFPVLLLELEDLQPDHPMQQLFMEEVALVPCWMFLPWVAQLLAHLPTHYSTLLPLVTRMAQEYPSALKHHYQLSRHMWRNLPNMKDAIQRLNDLLLDPYTSDLVKAIGSLRCPWTSLKYFIERLNKCDQTERKEILDELKDDLLVYDGGSSSSIHGQIFHDVRDSVLKLQSIKDMEDSVQLCNVLREVLMDCEQGRKTLPDRSNILRFSPYLNNYSRNVLDVAMEVFGQYDGFHTSPPDPKNHITIVKFLPEVKVFKTKQCPFKMSLYGSNGRKYDFLVKCNEDLRQDNRIQQILELMNHPLKQISMHNTTYKVFPLTQSLGVIEYVKDHATFNSLICHGGNNAQDVMVSVQKSRRDFINNFRGNNMADKYGDSASPQNMPENIAHYKDKVKSIPRHYLRDAIQKIAITSEMFVKMKSNFIRTLAAMNVSHWILGIGDRHLSNCMMSLTTGNILGIDFGYAFGTATQQLDVPELMPFRLTPQILGVLGTDNELKELMWQSLNILCQHRNLLLAALEVFAQEPTLSWTKDDAQLEWRPRNKINQCQRKLNGVDPITIVLEDLQSSIVGEKYTLNYCSVLRNVASEQKALSVEEQVERLIKLATDDGVMSVTYIGWNPYF